MPQFEHRLYEPGEDMKALDGPEDEDEVENSRLPLLIVLALLVLAMFAGFVWLAYNEGVARGRSENPLLASDGAAKPGANAGASAQAYKGFKIYEQPAPPDDDTGATQQSESAKSPPAPKAAAIAKADMSKSATKTEALSVPKPAAKASPEAKLARAPSPAPVATGAPRALMAKAAPASSQPVPSLAAASSAYVLQIGAYKSQAEADAAWTRYKAKHSVLLDGYSPNVAQADLGAKGVWYRLRIAGFPSKDVADALCDRLKADGGACFLGR